MSSTLSRTHDGRNWSWHGGLQFPSWHGCTGPWTSVRACSYQRASSIRTSPPGRVYHQPPRPPPPMGSIHHPGTRTMQSPGAPPMSGYHPHNSRQVRRSPSPPRMQGYEHSDAMNGGPRTARRVDQDSIGLKFLLDPVPTALQDRQSS